MRKHALILGGTKGLGRELAAKALKYGFTPIIVGRTAEECRSDQTLAGAVFVSANLAAPYAAPLAVIPVLAGLDVSHVFWTAGIFLKRPLGSCETSELDEMAKTHFLGPVATLRDVHKTLPGPYHLTVVASTSSFRMREHETVYAALKSAKAQFARHFAKELAAERPGSKTLLVNPGGMKTGFLASAGIDASKMMEPAIVAELIWVEVTMQRTAFCELNVMRTEDGSPQLVYGPQRPETP